MKQRVQIMSHKITVMILNHRILKYLLIVPIILVLVHAFYSTWLNDEITSELLNEKFQEKIKTLNLMSSIVDEFVRRDDDWDSYDYDSLFSDMMTQLDITPFEYAAAYDDQLNLLSIRESSNSDLFDPLKYPEFTKEITHNDGEVVITFKPNNGLEAQDIYLCYTWLPTSTQFDNRILVVTGISKLSVATRFTVWVSYGNIILSAITAICNCLMIALLYSHAAAVETIQTGGKRDELH